MLHLVIATMVILVGSPDNGTPIGQTIQNDGSPCRTVQSAPSTRHFGGKHPVDRDTRKPKSVRNVQRNSSTTSSSGTKIQTINQYKTAEAVK